jgi:predicted permease
MLFKTPFVTLVAIASLALGIGANAAIFSMFDQILWRPLPVHSPSELVNLSAPGPKPGSQSANEAGDSDDVFSYPMFRDLQRTQRCFTGIAAHRSFGANLAYRGQTSSGSGMLVSGNYFPLLGLQPAAGRLLTPDDDRNAGAHFVVVLGHDYWRTRFDADPGVVNGTLVVNGQAMTIVGVAPPGFRGTTLGTDPEVFVPISMREAMTPGWKGLDSRQNYWAYLFARLKTGVSMAQARAAINMPYHGIVNDVEAPMQKGMSEQTMTRFRAKAITLADGARGQSSIRGSAAAPLTLLLGVTAFVLLIACANIANLLLARSAARATEMAVRLSIGASRSQLLGQLLTESCLLGVFGAAAGLLVARWTLGLISSLLPSDAGAVFTPGLDGRVLLFAAGLAIGTGVLFGLFPALHSTRPDLVTALKGTAGQSSGTRTAARFRWALATAQIAISMALLVSAGLFMKSLANISRVDLGLKPDRLIAFWLSPDLNGYTSEQARSLYERLEDNVAATPGVSSMAASMVPLLADDNYGTNVSVEGFSAGPDTDTVAMFNEVGPGYFRTLGIPILLGREFTRDDALSRPKVAVVNEAFANKFNLGRDAVGKHMRRGSGGALDVEIVGLVQNSKYSDVKRPVPPIFCMPYRQDAAVGSMTFYVRTAGPEEQLLGTIPAIVRQLDRNLPVNHLGTMRAQVRENVFVDRLIGTLSTSFAILATLLAAVGLYGVLSYTITQRTREIGLRIAVGADPARVRRLVLGQVARMALVGGVIGLGGAALLGHAARSMLYELGAQDPIVFIASAAALTLVAFGAGLIPAQRASRIDPIKALRYE